MNQSTIEYQALLLPIAERARLAHQLLLSLDNLSEQEMAEVWLDEAQRRAEAIDNGQVELVSSETVSMKARQLLK